MHDQKHMKISKWWPLIIYMMRKRIMVGIGAWDPDPTYQLEDTTSWACREIIMAREPEKSFDHHHLLWWISSIFRLNWQLYSCIYLSSYFRKRDPLGPDEMTLRTDSASVLCPVHTFWHSDPTMHTIWVNLLAKGSHNTRRWRRGNLYRRSICVSVVISEWCMFRRTISLWIRSFIQNNSGWKGQFVQSLRLTSHLLICGHFSLFAQAMGARETWKSCKWRLT